MPDSDPLRSIHNTNRPGRPDRTAGTGKAVSIKVMTVPANPGARRPGTSLQTRLSKLTAEDPANPPDAPRSDDCRTTGQRNFLGQSFRAHAPPRCWRVADGGKQRLGSRAVTALCRLHEFRIRGFHAVTCPAARAQTGRGETAARVWITTNCYVGRRNSRHRKARRGGFTGLM
ncbi:hypothetical protein Ari01nite_75820 [Paractinoplanes rishiriensis]|uniref:Uncharacterized protein n=1 Tax=Paractinoplanes rishiriensis TaxID=1050105 RepID=A0A919N2H2_9ACTN|nr:hypothetical protein Ari01nite_75820 [Actinoplanes rishiriensis]